MGVTCKILDWRSEPPKWARSGVVAIGNFDGVHLGHVALIQQASQLAKSLDTRLTIITFDPHPLQLLAPERFQRQLMDIESRVHYLLHCDASSKGADGVVVLRTDQEMLQLSPEAFFQDILVSRFRAKGIVEGFNFRFGKDRAGSIEMLRELCERAGIRFQVVEPFELDGVAVSSSRVRNSIEAGQVELAAKMLGRKVRVIGTVVKGAQRGRTIGFPTANLGDTYGVIPGNGVYAVEVLWDEMIANGNFTPYPGAANIGPNQTFAENARKIEIHVLDFNGDLYGQRFVVDFETRLRDTQKFNSVDELTLQMKQDIELARRVLAEGGKGNHGR